MPLAGYNFTVDPSLHPAASHQHRVLLVTNSYDRNIDGVALTLNRLVSHLIRRGHEVLVVVPSRPRGAQPPALVASGRLVRVPSVKLPIWWEYRLTWGLGRKVQKQLAAFDPTVVHIAIQDAMGHAAQKWALTRNIPVVCSHHTRFERYLRYYGLGYVGLESLYWFGMRRFHRGCAATLPPSDSLAHVLTAHGIERVGVWPRGVDCALYNPSHYSEAWRARVDAAAGAAAAAGGGGRGGGAAAAASGSGTGSPPPSSPAAPIVLLVARLRWEKGLQEFAAVVNELGARGVVVRVAVVGDGPAREGLRALLPPSAIFFGELTGLALAEAYASSDIFLFPSTTEGWGATCLEAQASGVPVVATRSSGIVEVLEHSVGGLLAPPHNVSALADHVSLLVNDGKLRRKMGRDAVKHAATFDWARSGDRMLCEYVRHAGVGASPRLLSLGSRPAPSFSEQLWTSAGYPPYTCDT